MALNNRNYVIESVRRKNTRDSLVEVANSEYSGRPLSFRNGRFLSSQISISPDSSGESIKSLEINEIINSETYKNMHSTLL